MYYSNMIPGIFLSRPNRFIAKVIIDGAEETVHVKNTGRCRELLPAGAEVWCQKADNPNRKTKYDLITVRKGERLINMDSQAPNIAAGEWLRAENAEYIMTIANEDRIKDSFCGAVRELIRWMCDGYGFSPQEAYLLLGQVLEARCTTLHGDEGPFSPYVAKIQKRFLKPDSHFDWNGPAE